MTLYACLVPVEILTCLIDNESVADLWQCRTLGTYDIRIRLVLIFGDS